MQFGIFDQNDRGPSPLAEQYENRLKLIEFYDRAGFRAYHMSEHHATPLNLAPSPSVFLAAAAQRTRRLGRGASPHELHYFGIDPDAAPAMYVEAYTVIRQALTQPEVNFNGKYYNFENVPIEMKSLQRPHPPFWYAVPVPDGAAWPALNGINIVCAGPVTKVREITDRYRAEWAAAGNSPDDIPLLGINRFVVTADTDRAAMAVGRRAWPLFHASFMKLWNKHGTQPRYARMPEDFDTMVANGGALAGSAATVRDQVRSMTEAAGASYFISQFSFGDLSHHEVLHSATLFADEVLPAVKERVA
jgi:alkanesulfonate monooxygenase SsuD/methylene tetrahydromethanopterin reductase-like flavin-dependent oxidoreductase (luciferase family)